MENNDITKFAKVDSDITEKGIDVSRLSYIQKYYRNQAKDLLSEYDSILECLASQIDTEELSQELKGRIAARLASLGKSYDEIKSNTLSWLIVFEKYEKIKENERTEYYKKLGKKYFTISSIADALSCSRDTLTDKKNDHFFSNYIDMLKDEYSSKQPEVQSNKQQEKIKELEEKIDKMVFRDNELMQLRYDYEKLYKNYLELKNKYDGLSAETKKKDEELWKLRVERGDIQFR